MSDDTFDRLTEKLAAMSERRRRERQFANGTEIADMFAECNAAGMGLPASGPDRRHYWDPSPEDLGPMPIEKEVGKRYCHGCGVHKRDRSFDEGADRCRACGGKPTRRSKAA